MDGSGSWGRWRGDELTGTSEDQAPGRPPLHAHLLGPSVPGATYPGTSRAHWVPGAARMGGEQVWAVPPTRMEVGPWREMEAPPSSPRFQSSVPNLLGASGHISAAVRLLRPIPYKDAWHRAAGRRTLLLGGGGPDADMEGIGAGGGQASCPCPDAKGRGLQQGDWINAPGMVPSPVCTFRQENSQVQEAGLDQTVGPLSLHLALAIHPSSGNFKGLCKQIDHFPEDADYEADTAEYFLRAVRASSIFPILSVILLFMGGLCIAASEFYKTRHNIILSAGIFFVSAGLSNIIGIIVYISANAGDPSKSDSKKNSYSYGWSFYFGALSFIIAEMVGVLAVHMFIDRHKQLRATARATDYLQASAITRIPSYRYRYQRRSRSSSRSTEPSHSRDASPVGVKGFNTLPSTEISMYTLSRDPLKAATTPTATYNSDRDNSFLQVHNCIQKENKDSLHSNTANRRTTPV
ncbi:Hypothetical predicted protein [Marmota monax]|uniref:Voltage-dependent calcium channel gamma-2 subunit n=1 Tax=Marmota monax TaxID=9995 RepID=A0A5E4CI12_MARMO|nr:voltage-dependent calcium channel gamma-2 subunit [Marmota monax]VTJ80562.1 Hypothetical predicted protein [Marmota monax]